MKTQPASDDWAEGSMSLMHRSSPHFRSSGFTILEILTVIVVIAILATMVTASYSALRDKARRGACINNLLNLHVGMESYLTDHDGVWPQVPNSNLRDPKYAMAWVDSLRPYKLTEINWICPSVQAAIGVNYVTFPRVDYLPTPFGTTARAAFQYGTQPWFVERADIHGDGNMMIFANGQIKSLNEAARDALTQSFQ